MSAPILELRGVGKSFRIGQHTVQALNSVDLRIETGECHAIVGESGSGKSTLGNLVLGIYPPSAGEIRFEGQLLPAKRPLDLKRRIQLVQQNPLSALNGKRSIGASLSLPLDVHALVRSRVERRQRISTLLEEVGLDPQYAERSPSTLSGGQRQRVAIARALACEPDLIVLDEPTSALDVLVQARVLRLLADLRTRKRLTYLFITHDLGVVRALADSVSVFRQGVLVESDSVQNIFANPKHPYTAQLIASIPVVTEEEAALRVTVGALAAAATA
jgi:peptide/nickel transport system ATP-binding protein